MPKSKQSSRKTLEGHASFELTMSGTLEDYRAYATNQQLTNHDTPAIKTSILNYDNIFYSFSFNVGSPEQNENFTPRYFAASTPSTSPWEARNMEEIQPAESQTILQQNPETVYWLGLSTVSKYDGPGISIHSRPPLNLAVALDVSSSMNFRFDSADKQCRSKLAIAKEGLYAIMNQLKPNDKLGIVVFDDTQQPILPMTTWAEVDKPALKQIIMNIGVGGGTNLSGGLHAASKLFGAVEETRTSRILFLTDLNSSCKTANDEEMLIECTISNAVLQPSGIYTTVVGVGMDFNVALVEKVSKTRGCRYMSITNVGEFVQMIEHEFDYDVFPLAFDIRLIVESANWTVDKAYGSPELGGFNKGKDQTIAFSSEFPSAHDEEGGAKGAIILFRLKRITGATVTARKNMGKGQQIDLTSASLKLTMNYKDVHGFPHSNTQEVQLAPTPSRHNVPTLTAPDTGAWYHGSAIRKAIALVCLVNTHNDYLMDDRNFLPPPKRFEPEWMSPSANEFVEWMVGMKRHKGNIRNFEALRKWFEQEIEACGDQSLKSSNQAYLEMIDKIVALEKDGINQFENKVEYMRGTKRKTGESARRTSAAVESIWDQITCAICLDIFTDPVQLTQCLHSFCRACLTTSVRNAGDRNLVYAPVTCPTCKTSTPASQVRPNFVIRNIIETLVDGESVKKDEDGSLQGTEEHNLEPKQKKTKVGSLKYKSSVGEAENKPSAPQKKD